MRVNLPPCQLAQMPEYNQTQRGAPWVKILVRFVADGKDHLLPLAAFGPECQAVQQLAATGGWFDIVANLRGREWQGKHFADLSVESFTASQPLGAPAPQQPQQGYPPQQQQAPPPQQQWVDPAGAQAPAPAPPVYQPPANPPQAPPPATPPSFRDEDSPF